MHPAHELRARIAAQGSVTVADYMEIASRHYYATRDPFGMDGDFTTAPEISQIFGELIGAWMANGWQQIGGKAVLCELGPGRGTLMQDMLRATRHVTGFHEALSIRMVETSPVLYEIQKKKLEPLHHKIAWQETLDGLPPCPLLLIANEFFDALPIHQYIRNGEREVERKIAFDDDRFHFEPKGNVCREASPMSLRIIERIAAHIAAYGGAALIIDYGYVNGSTGDTLQALEHHAFADPLENPGERDITAHVDFAALSLAAKAAGAHIAGPVEQGTFLKRLGAELRAMALCKKASASAQRSILSGLERLIAPSQMGSLFKVMAMTARLETPSGF